jgi:hypothetical protein
MSGLFAQKPTATVGHSGDRAPDLETLGMNRGRLRQIIIQGNMSAKLRQTLGR